MKINATKNISKNYEKEKPGPTTPRTTPNRARRYLLPSRSTCLIFREKNLLVQLPSPRRRPPRGQRPPPPFTSNKNWKTIEAKTKVLQFAPTNESIGINQTKPTQQGPSLGSCMIPHIQANAFQTKNAPVRNIR
jgi:hypothetical protein